MHQQNAQIVKTSLGMHGESLTSSLDLKIGESVGVSFGGLRLCNKGIAVAFDSTSWWIMGILELRGVDSWERVAGQYIRIESETPNGPVVRIGHIVKDRWFDIRQATQPKREVGT